MTEMMTDSDGPSYMERGAKMATIGGCTAGAFAVQFPGARFNMEGPVGRFFPSGTPIWLAAGVAGAAPARFF